MDDFTPDLETRRAGPLTRGMFCIAGAQNQILRHCPDHDWDAVRAIALLFIFVWFLQGAELSIVAHQLLAPDGEVHPELIIGSLFIATLILMIDSYVFGRAGYHYEGLKELARGGLDLTGGLWAKLKVAIFYLLRILLSAGFAIISAIFAALILFQGDLSAEDDRDFLKQNTELISTVTHQVDDEIQRADGAVKDASTHLITLQKQVAAMRDGAVDPAATSAAVQAAQQEVTQLLSEKSQRDAELVAAQTFATNELAGIKGDPNNSGQPGRGPARIAAEERVKTATANDAAAIQALADARARLGDLRKQASSNAGDRSHRAQLALPSLEADLQAATTQLAALRDNLTKLTQNRNETIRAGIDKSPERVGRNTGFLAQLEVLKRLAQDPSIAAVILLIGLTSFGLEMAAVLAKTTSFIPTTYAALLARNAYMNTVEIVDEMDEKLRRRPSEPDGEADRPEPIFPRSGGSGQANPDHLSDEAFPLDAAPATNGNGIDPAAGKRPRGRPRKFPLN